MQRSIVLNKMYKAMLEALGPSGWWPANTPFEVAVGAILTQNTNWSNVEKAIANLRSADALTPSALLDLPEATLAELIRPSGYYKVKATRLRNMLTFLQQETDCDFDALQSYETSILRERLLGVKGIGPETADSILLYALGKPSFVVDAYTKRIMNRHALIHEDCHYEELRELFTDALPEDVGLYNEFHALLVRVGNRFCRPRKPLCDQCPLEPFLD